MATTWNPPVSLPRFDDDEMKRKKAEYVAEHGYNVSCFKLRDIVHVRRHEEPDDREWKLWRAGNRKELGDRRFDEIEQIISDKRRRYNNILASPVPTVAKNWVSVATFLDDINDTLGTAALVARFAARLLPRVLGRFLLGPAGWLLLGAEILSLIIHMMRGGFLSPAFCILGKRSFHKYGEMNPFSKKARARRAHKLRRLSPSKAEIIEALQVTDSMFGIGLCLGPLFAFPMDVVSGAYRSIRGERVTWFKKPPPLHEHEKKSIYAIRNAQIAAAINPILTEEEQLGMYWALFSAAQVVQAYNNEFDILANLESIEGFEFEAPTPKHPTTLHVLAEMGWNGRDGIGWPGADQRWMDPMKLWDLNAQAGGQKLLDFCKRNRNDYRMVFGAQAAADYSKLMVLMASDPGSVQEEWDEYHEGWAKFYEDHCVLHDCGIGFRYGTFRFQYCYHQFGDTLVALCCTDTPPPWQFIKKQPPGIFLNCRDCRIYAGPELCTGVYKKYISSYASERVVGEPVHQKAGL